MGQKETLLAELNAEDRTGHLVQLHNLLIQTGLKYRGPSNSRTLYYYVLDN